MQSPVPAEEDDMEIQTYEDWSRGVHQRLGRGRIPVSGAIELTRRCNLSCVHCYNNLPANDAEIRSAELTAEEHCRILDEITEAGCLWLLYTGGEIFAREDFPDIYCYAKKKGLFITLFTNGTLITPALADFLAKWPPFSIEISLYGRTRETHDRVTRVPGSYERSIKGVERLRERRLPLVLKTMAMTVNRDELWDMKAFVEDGLGLEFRFDAMINPRVDCSLAPLRLRLSPREVVALDLRDSRRTTEWVKFCEHFNRSPEELSPGDELYECGGGLNAFAVDPAGRLSPCVLSRGETYDLRKGSFKEGWETSLFQLTRKKITKQTKCMACGIKAMCGMCPANGELECGDPEAPVDFLCQVAHLRAYALGMPVAAHGECEYCKGGRGYDAITNAGAALRALRSGNGVPLRVKG